MNVFMVCWWLVRIRLTWFQYCVKEKYEFFSWASKNFCPEINRKFEKKSHDRFSPVNNDLRPFWSLNSESQFRLSNSCRLDSQSNCTSEPVNQSEVELLSINLQLSLIYVFIQNPSAKFRSYLEILSSWYFEWRTFSKSNHIFVERCVYLDKNNWLCICFIIHANSKLNR